MATARREFDRPAFYALSAGGWRDLVTILHPPYTLWHLSYVALGAAAAPTIYANRLIAALGAFFLAVGLSSHALDELRGRPLNTKLGQRLADRDRGHRPRRSGRDRGDRRVRRVAVDRAAGDRRRPAGAGLQPRAGRRPLPQRRLVRDRLGSVSSIHRLLLKRPADPARRDPRDRGLRADQPRSAAPEHTGPRAPAAHRYGRRRAANERRQSRAAQSRAACGAARGSAVGDVARAGAAIDRAGSRFVCKLCAPWRT